jgi:hypothetical protein
VARWYVVRETETFGPLTPAELTQLADKGGLQADDRIRATHSDQAVRAGDVPELSHLFRRADGDEGDSPLPTAAIVAIVFVVPIAGAFMYYAWKDTHPNAARLANGISFAAFALWAMLGCCVLAAVSRP